VAVASAGPYANLHLNCTAPHPRQITTPASHYSIFTGRMPFLPLNQQHQSTEGHDNNNNTRLTALYREYLGEPVPER